MQTTSSIGKTGEQIAANFLEKHGFKILETNYQNDSGRRIGEIDIVAQDKDEIVFVEVKTRDIKYFNTLPEENITYSKLRKLSKIASVFLRKRKLDGEPYRFDAISVWIDFENRNAKVKHLRNIYL